MRSLLQLRACILLMMSFTFINQALYSQSTCPNADFASTNFSNWQGFYGTYNNPAQNTGFIGGRHTIFAAPGFDPMTCGGLSVLPPGGGASARLGNQGTGGLAEQLRYGLVVDPQNALFVYKYAVVLENPSDHDPNEQPEFSVRLLDAAGNPIGGPCGTYTVYAGQPGQNFNSCGGVTWLPWTTVGIDLTAFMGQQVFIEFTTKDCSLGAHFGYAYISAGCSPLELQLAYCAGDQIISMEAPTGFQTYTWNPGNLTGQTINVPTPADGTIYTCTMSTFSNQGNCAVDVTVTVEPTIVTANFPPGAACINNNLLFLDSSLVNVGSITNWNWDFGDGITSTDQFPSHPYTTGGTFTAQLIAMSDQGCSDTITQDITVFDLPSVSFTQISVCSSDTAHFVNASTDQFPLSFNWDFGDNSTDTVTSPDHLYANPNNYSVTLTATSSFGCVNSLTQLTNVFPLPAVNAGPDATLCLFSDLILNATGATSYSWSNGLPNGSSFSPTAGTYLVTGTDGNGCVNVDSMIVGFFPDPVVNAGPDVTTCENQPVSLNATGMPNLNWNNGILNNDPFIPPLGTTIYEVIGLDANGCSDTDQVAILVHPLPVVNFTFTAACVSDPLHFENGSSNPYPLTYSWNFGDGNSSNVVSPDHNFAISNLYTVTLTATSSVGCVNSLSQQTNVFPLPAVYAGTDTTLCVFGELMLNATGATSYSWSNGLPNGSVFAPAPGYYVVTGTDTNGCSNTDSLQVSFFAPPVIDAGADVVVCLHDMVTLNASGTPLMTWDSGVINAVAFEPPMGNWTFEVVGWDANGCSDTDQVAVTVHPLPIVDAGQDQIICRNTPITLNGSGAATYSWTGGIFDNTPFTPTIASFYTVTGTDQFGCISNDSVYIQFEQAPVLTGSFSLTNGCAPLEVDFMNNSGTTNNCFWNISDGNSVNGCNTTYTFENDGCFDITLVSTSPLGCVYDTTFSSAVCVYPLPNAAFQPSPYYMLETEPITHMENSTTGADSYSWNFGDGTGSQQFDPWHTYPEEVGNYEIILTATSDHGCVDTAHATVYVEEDLIYYVPNTFTPDGDGNNDEFKPVVESGIDPHYYHFWIYDRWGETVFESEDIEEGWNGSFRGLVAQDGTYTWKIEFKSTIHRRVDNVVTGHVNILK